MCKTFNESAVLFLLKFTYNENYSFNIEHCKISILRDSFYYKKYCCISKISRKIFLTINTRLLLIYRTSNTATNKRTSR